VYEKNSEKIVKSVFRKEKEIISFFLHHFVATNSQLL